MTPALRQKIKVTGIVQGVGFRPWVYRLATELCLTGSVLNNAAGVTIEIQGSSKQLEQFVSTLRQSPPPLSNIDDIIISYLPCLSNESSFVILQSQDDCEISVSVSPDMSCCDDCLSEVNDPQSRFYQYPFTNCTNCGPRYSIIRALPYDRPNTAMAEFAMCSDCEQEYHNPLNRRYHAQPISCPQCGPQLTLLNNQGTVLAEKHQALSQAADAILAGKIIAVKGLGGFHLMCDATNQDTVVMLRLRKYRPAKPLAVMAHDLKMAQHLVCGTKAEWQQLTSKERPIVLMKKTEANIHTENPPTQILCEAIAPELERLGIFLPYTPLHHLLMAKLGRPIVATSANISGEPIISDVDDIIANLSHVADLVLDHNRPIINPCDDSVIQLIDNELQVMRLARGYAPLSVVIKEKVKQTDSILAVGPQQKNTLALSTAGKILLSPHIGDLFSLSSEQYFDHSRQTLETLYQTQPNVIVKDLHPDYASSRWAIQATKANPTIKLVNVQHHYAHILAVMAANQYRGEVLGFSFDGTGLGDDNSLWGGEMLRCDLSSFQRLGHWQQFSLIGMEQAVKQPWRILLALLFQRYTPAEITKFNLPILAHLSDSMIANIHALWSKKQRCIETSSTGRLFDAVAALLGIVSETRFEGEAGIKLEQLANQWLQTQQTPDSDCQFKVHCTQAQGRMLWDTQDLFCQLLRAVQAQALTQNRIQEIALGFIQALADLIVNQAAPYQGLPVVLSGGVFQNRLLLSLSRKGLKNTGHILLDPKLVPINDAGIALGQLWHGLHQN